MNRHALALTIAEIIKHNAGMHKQGDHAGKGGFGHQDKDESNSGSAEFWTGSYKRQAPSSTGSSTGSTSLRDRIKAKQTPAKRSTFGALW